MTNHDDFLDLSVISEVAEDSIPPRRVKLGPGVNDEIVFRNPLEALDIFEGRHVIAFVTDASALAAKMDALKNAPKHRRDAKEREYSAEFLEKYPMDVLVDILADWVGSDGARKLEARGLRFPEYRKLMLDLGTYFGDAVKN